MNRVITIGLGTVICLLLCGFLYKNYYASDRAPVAPDNVDPIALKRARIVNKHIVDTAVSMLRSGNVVVRMGLGADSKLLSELNSRDKSFSHCGIVFIENGYPFVYHAIGGEDNPDERLRRDSARFFFSPTYNSEIGILHFSFDSDNINELRKVVYNYYRLRPKFDMKFDLATDDKLYCSEFVYKAIDKAMKDTGYIQPTTLFGHRFIGIDDIYMNSHADIVWRMKFK